MSQTGENPNELPENQGQEEQQPVPQPEEDGQLPEVPQEGEEVEPSQPDNELTPECEYEGLVNTLPDAALAFDEQITRAMKVFKSVAEILRPYYERKLFQKPFRDVLTKIYELPEEDGE